jgi:hypothetical protein
MIICEGRWTNEYPLPKIWRAICKAVISNRMEKPKDGMAFTESTSGNLKAEEPAAAYSSGHKKLTVSTVEEQEQDNYLYWLSLSPSQRIANATELIRKVYAIELNMPSKTKRIIFDKIEDFTE